MSGYGVGGLRVPLNLVSIQSWMPISAELAAEFRLEAMGPELGPPLPMSLALRRRLGGGPVGAYRRQA